MSNQPGDESQLRLKYWFKRAIALIKREPTTIAELLSLLRDMKAHHLIKSDILNMMERIGTLSNTKVLDVMISRDKMVIIQEDATFDTILSIVNESGHSRFPVLNKKGDQVKGILLAKDLLRYVVLVNRHQFALSSVLRKAAYIGENKPLDTLLKDFRRTRNHLAVVLDQYSQIAGIVTLEDVLEQIVGSIDDEYDL